MYCLAQFAGELLRKPDVILRIDGQPIMGMRITGGTARDYRHRKGLGAGDVGADARTERVIEPDRALTVRSDTGDMGTTVRSRSTLRRRNGILRHTISTAFQRPLDGKAANIAVKSFRPPDTSMVIEGNQVGSSIASCFSEVFINIGCAQRTGERRSESANPRDSLIIFCEPERACAGIWAGNTVRIATRCGSRGLSKVAGFRVKFADLARAKFRKPEIASPVEGEVVGHGIRSWHKKLVPGRIAAARNEFANGIYRWFREPEPVTRVNGEKERSRITRWLYIILYKGKVLAAIFGNSGWLLWGTRRCWITARFGHPDVAIIVKAYSPGDG